MGELLIYIFIAGIRFFYIEVKFNFLKVFPTLLFSFSYLFLLDINKSWYVMAFVTVCFIFFHVFFFFFSLQVIDFIMKQIGF